MLEPSSASSSSPPSLAAISAVLRPIVPDSLSVLSRFPEARAFGENNASYYIPDFLTKLEADAVLPTIGSELERPHAARDDPTVQVPMYKLKRGVSRDKAALSDAAGSLRPLYRYGAPELAQAHPFSMAPTVLRIRDLIFARLGVRSNHCIGNRYRKQRGWKGEKKDGIGSHQDKDRDFSVGGPILTLTFCEPGGERTLEVTKWEHRGETITQFNRKQQREIVKPVKSKVHTESIVMAHGSLTIIDWNWILHGQTMGLVCNFIVALIYMCAAKVEESKFFNSNPKNEYEAYSLRTGMFWPRLL